ncbi:hypothetical protein R3P38DRAFT_2903483 [Favolaschia claudopus]|uniref:F-box domain-containing protein n=1 Tax=Favolaschia claudopus TaxID=2862362 RepID=A0AAW0CI51_9AGAR
MLDRFPPEICDHIFEFACRDTGFTGCSLSLVSKYIQHTAAPTRYLSVALTSHAQILAFARLVENSEALFHTKYLYLNGYLDEEAMDKIENAVYVAATQASVQYRELHKQLPAGDERLDEAKAVLDREGAKARAEMVEFGREVAIAVEKILRRVASSVEVLYISLNEKAAKAMENTLSLPHLRDLTTRGGFPLHPNNKNVPVVEPTNSLLHLHAVETFDQWAWTGDYFRNGISYLAPSLTHLRLSDLRTDDGTLEYLESSLGSSTVLKNGITLLPSTLELVVLKPTVEPPPYVGCSCSDDTPQYYDMIKFGRRLRDRDHRVVMLHADKVASADDAYLHEWMDKVNGMACRWDTGNEDIAPAED